MYNPELGRFLQPDPLLGDPLRPKTLNPYSYAINDPLNFHDPTGLQAEAVPLIEGGHTDFNKRPPEPPPPGIDLAIGELVRSEFGADDHLRGAQPVTPASATSQGGAQYASAGNAGAATDAGPAASGEYGNHGGWTQAVNWVLGVTGIKALGGLALSRFSAWQLARWQTSLPFKTGDIITRTIPVRGGAVDIVADVGIQGRNLTLSRFAIDSAGSAGKLDIGVVATRQIFRTLTSEMRALGFHQMRLSATRLTGANPGRHVDLIIPLR